MNRIQLMGRCGSGMDMSFTPSGTAVGKFSVATSKPMKKKDGSTEWQTTWHRVVVFGRVATKYEKEISKGFTIFLEGEQQNREWEKDGVRRTASEVVAYSIMVKPKDANGHEGTTNEVETGTFTEDSIPF